MSRPRTVLHPPALSFTSVVGAIRTLPRYSHLIAALTLHRIRVRYKHSILGPLWAVLQPLAMMVIFAIVFSILSRVPSHHPYALFAYTGLLPWTAFAAALGSAATSLVTHAPLVTRVYFPREILPLSYVLTAPFDLAVASTVLAGMLAWYAIPIGATVVWVLPLLLLLASLALAVSLALSAINIRFRDVGLVMPLLLQVWMFASPVIYPLSAVPPAWRGWYTLNPMVGIVDGFRRAVLDASPPDARALTMSLVVVLVLLPASYVWFKQVEATMADWV